MCHSSGYNYRFYAFSAKSDIVDEEDDDQPKISRHYLYTTHFPLYQGDTVSQHDCNQRYVLLFGVGKERDDKKHAVKKMAKGMIPCVNI